MKPSDLRPFTDEIYSVKSGLQKTGLRLVFAKKDGSVFFYDDGALWVPDEGAPSWHARTDPWFIRASGMKAVRA